MRRSAAALMSSVLALVTSCRSQATPAPAIAPALSAESPAKPTVVWSQEPIASGRVPSGELTGVVLDAETAAPLAMVQVWRPNKSVPVVSDSAGRFRIPAPNVGETVRFMRIGYAPYQVTIPRSDSGLIAVVALRAYAIAVCRVSVGTAVYEVDSKGKRDVTPVERYPGVVVIARDALTGRAPEHGVTVLVRDNAFRDSVTAMPGSTGAVVANAALDREGRYDVVVRSAGYRDWSRSSETRPIPECPGEFIPAVFHAWLIPR